MGLWTVHRSNVHGRLDQQLRFGKKRKKGKYRKKKRVRANVQSKHMQGVFGKIKNSAYFLFFGTIYGSYYIISANFYLYLQTIVVSAKKFQFQKNKWVSNKLIIYNFFLPKKNIFHLSISLYISFYYFRYIWSGMELGFGIRGDFFFFFWCKIIQFFKQFC